MEAEMTFPEQLREMEAEQIGDPEDDYAGMWEGWDWPSEERWVICFGWLSSWRRRWRSWLSRST
jgi:hypothetical protein